MSNLDLGIIQNQLSNTQTSIRSVTRNSSEAESVAKQFEALLVQQMIKGMKKTTLDQGTSNAMSIYDDMLAEKLSSELVESGSLGIAEQILRQIEGQLRTNDAEDEVSEQPITSDILKLRKLARESYDVQTVAFKETYKVTKTTGYSGNPAEPVQQNYRTTARLGFIENLWGSRTPQIPKKHSDFLTSLLHQAKTSADTLNTKPSAILAIAALETGWGSALPTHEDGLSSHNLFGIKSSKKHEQYTSNITTEYIDGVPRKLLARFKSYSSPADSLRDFVNFLQVNPRYQEALSNAENPHQFLRELHKAGYATDPDYSDKAISIMKQINSYGIQ